MQEASPCALDYPLLDILAVKEQMGDGFQFEDFKLTLILKKGSEVFMFSKGCDTIHVTSLKSLSSKKMMRSASQSSCNLGSKASEEYRVLKHVMFACKVFNKQSKSLC